MMPINHRKNDSDELPISRCANARNSIRGSLIYHIIITVECVRREIFKFRSGSFIIHCNCELSGGIATRRENEKFAKTPMEIDPLWKLLCRWGKCAVRVNWWISGFTCFFLYTKTDECRCFVYFFCLCEFCDNCVLQFSGGFRIYMFFAWVYAGFT